MQATASGRRKIAPSKGNRRAPQGRPAAGSKRRLAELVESDLSDFECSQLKKRKQNSSVKRSHNLVKNAKVPQQNAGKW